MGRVNAYGYPGIDPRFSSEDRQVWWGLRDQQIFVGVDLWSGTQDTGNTAGSSGGTAIPSVLRAGLVLGQIQVAGAMGAVGQWMQYNKLGSAAGGAAGVTAGVDVASAVLEFGIDMRSMDGTPVGKGLPVLVGGRLKASQLIGLDGAARAQLGGNGRFIFDDDLPNAPSRSTGGWLREAAASTRAITAADNGTLFIFGGAATMTLPSLASVAPGFRVGFWCDTAGAAVVQHAGADVIHGTATLVGVTLTAGAIGSGCVVESNQLGTFWRERNTSAGITGGFAIS